MVQLLLGQQRQLGQSSRLSEQRVAAQTRRVTSEILRFPAMYRAAIYAMYAIDRTANTRENDIHRAYPSI